VRRGPPRGPTATVRRSAARGGAGNGLSGRATPRRPRPKPRGCGLQGRRGENFVSRRRGPHELRLASPAWGGGVAVRGPSRAPTGCGPAADMRARDVPAVEGRWLWSVSRTEETRTLLRAAGQSEAPRSRSGGRLLGEGASPSSGRSRPRDGVEVQGRRRGEAPAARPAKPGSSSRFRRREGGRWLGSRRRWDRRGWTTAGPRRDPHRLSVGGAPFRGRGGPHDQPPGGASAPSADASRAGGARPRRERASRGQGGAAVSRVRLTAQEPREVQEIERPEAGAPVTLQVVGSPGQALAEKA